MINDTAPWVAELLLTERRKMSPAQKLALVDDLNLALHYLALSLLSTPSAPAGVSNSNSNAWP